MLKKLIVPAMATTILLAGCSSGDLGALQSDVEALKQDVAQLKSQLGSPDSTSDEAAQTGDSNEPGAGGKGSYSLGEQFVFEGITYNVTEGERKQQLSEDIVADEGYEFAIFNMDIHNTSSDDYQYSQSNYSIVTGTGEIEDNYLIIDMNDQYDDLGNGELAPNGKRSGWVAFEVPQGDQPVELRYEELSFSNKSSFKVKLQ